EGAHPELRLGEFGAVLMVVVVVWAHGLIYCPKILPQNAELERRRDDTPVAAPASGVDRTARRPPPSSAASHRRGRHHPPPRSRRRPSGNCFRSRLGGVLLAHVVVVVDEIVFIAVLASGAYANCSCACSPRGRVPGPAWRPCRAARLFGLAPRARGRGGPSTS